MIFRGILLIVSILALSAEVAQSMEKWSGVWRDSSGTQGGQLDFFLMDDGKIEGNITNGTSIGLWNGFIRNDGVMFTNYQYYQPPLQGFAAQSVARITQNQGNQVSGPMVFLQNNRVFSTGSFRLTRTSISRQAINQYPFTGNGMYIFCAAPSICGQRGGNLLPGNWGWTSGLFSDLKRNYPQVWCNLYPGSCGTR